MRKLARYLPVLALVMAPFAAAGEEFVHEASGTKIAVPDGWERDYSREGGSTIFAATLDGTSKGEQVRFEMEIAGASSFDPESWIAGEATEKKSWFKSVKSAFAKEADLVIGSRAAVGYTIAGTRESDGEETAMHFRRYAVVNAGAFVQITIIAYNAAELTMDAAVKQMLASVAFSEPKAREIDLTVPEGAAETPVDDPKGNLKMVLPPGWSAKDAPPDDGDAMMRLIAIRPDQEGNVVAALQLRRYQISNTSFFVQQTPTSFLTDEKKNLFGFAYGETGNPDLESSEGIPFGGVEKCGAFKVSGLREEDAKKVLEAEQQQKRGLKVEVPRPPPKVISGRVAMNSPFVYLALIEFALGQDQNPALLAETEKMLDSFQLLDTKRRTPPLTIHGQEIGNTADDPANAKARPDTVKKEANAVGKVVDTITFKYKIPERMIKCDPANYGPDTILMLAGQDKDNNWVRVVVGVLSAKALSFENKVFQDKKVEFTSWKSNWENMARGKKVPPKPRPISFGGVQGDGYEFVGEIDGFPATRTNALADKSGWRIIIEIETRGVDLKAFDKQVDAFLKNFRMQK